MQNTCTIVKHLFMLICTILLQCSCCTSWLPCSLHISPFMRMGILPGWLAAWPLPSVPCTSLCDSARAINMASACTESQHAGWPPCCIDCRLLGHHTFETRYLLLGLACLCCGPCFKHAVLHRKHSAGLYANILCCTGSTASACMQTNPASMQRACTAPRDP